MTKPGPFNDSPASLLLAPNLSTLDAWQLWTAGGKARYTRGVDLRFRCMPVVKGRATEEPGTPSLDDAWIVTSAWGTGDVNQIAVYDGADWLFIDPEDGAIVMSLEADGYVEQYTTASGWTQRALPTVAELIQALAGQANYPKMTSGEVDTGEGTDARSIDVNTLLYAVSAAADITAYTTDTNPPASGFTDSDTLIIQGVVQVGLQIDELGDVDVTGLSDAMVLVYQASTDTWLVGSLSDIAGYNAALLADHSAITITAGDGLSGGGSIDASLSLSVDSSVSRSGHTHTGAEAWAKDPALTIEVGTPVAGRKTNIPISGSGRTLRIETGFASGASLKICATTAPTAATKFLVNKSTDGGASFTTIGEFTVATNRAISNSDNAGGGANSFPQTDFSDGNILQLEEPNPADATLDGFSATITFLRTA